jgi:hypothetical protein
MRRSANSHCGGGINCNHQNSVCRTNRIESYKGPTDLYTMDCSLCSARVRLRLSVRCGAVRCGAEAPISGGGGSSERGGCDRPRNVSSIVCVVLTAIRNA